MINKKTSLLACSIFLFCTAASYAQESDSMIYQQAPQQGKPPLELTHKLVVFDQQELPIAGYVYLNNKPLVNLTSVQDSPGGPKKFVVSEMRAKTLNRIFQAINPDYVPGSAFQGVVASVTDPQGGPQLKELIIVDYAVAGLIQTEPGYFGRTINNTVEQAKVIELTKSLSSYVKEHDIFVKHGVSRYTLSEVESGRGIQVGDIIEIKKK